MRPNQAPIGVVRSSRARFALAILATASGLVPAKGRELRGHAQGGGRLVATIRPRTEPGCVGLDENSSPGSRPAAARGPSEERKLTGSANETRKPPAGQVGRHSGVTREAMRTPGAGADWPADSLPYAGRQREERSGHIVMGVPVVDEHRLAIRSRQLELARERSRWVSGGERSRNKSSPISPMAWSGDPESASSPPQPPRRPRPNDAGAPPPPPRSRTVSVAELEGSLGARKVPARNNNTQPANQ